MFTLYASLGNTPALSLAELRALTKNDVSLLSFNFAKINTTFSPETLGSVLGGTTKLITKLTTTTSKSLIADLCAQINLVQNKNIAITTLADNLISQQALHQIKDTISRSRPIRLLSLKTKDHSLIALRKQNVAEFVVFCDNNTQIIGKTIWIHDAEDWILRDRQKPYRDIKRGMLPPKIARIMVNLGCQGKKGLTLADPFCGTGTVLTEAAMVGCTKLIGGDTNQLAISLVPQNLTWLKNHYQDLSFDASFYVLDATHFDEKITAVDCIVTEPYMGPLLESTNLPNLNKLNNIAKGLTKLYRGALKSWRHILPKNGRVVIAIPSFNAHYKTINTLAVDDYAELGYNYISSVAYGKPKATVTRNITILEKV